AAGVLSQMARQTLNRAAEGTKSRGARMFDGQASLLHLVGQFERMRKVSVRIEAGKALQNVLGKIERFADFARGAAPAIGDDVGRHCGAAASVAPINFLDDALAAVAAGKVNVNVWPGILSAFG